MPISAADPRYRAERTPPSIAALGPPLRAHYGVGADAFGAKGNLVHYSGYHRSERWLRGSPDSRYAAADYSLQGALNASADVDAICAFDFTPGAWGTAENRRRMREITRRVYDAARARDPRLASLREFAGTLDGRTVITFNCADGALKTPFDTSHLDHVHASFWRARALRSHTGVLAVILGQPSTEPATVPPTLEDTMLILARATPTDPTVWLCDGFRRRDVTTQVGSLQTLAQHGALNLWKGGQIWAPAELHVFGPIIDGAATITLTEQQTTALAAAIVARPDNPLGPADQPAIAAALRDVLRTGVDA